MIIVLPRGPRVGVPVSIRLADFKSTVKSPHGEDGVIDAIFRQIGVEAKTCVEFGAYDQRDDLLWMTKRIAKQCVVEARLFEQRCMRWRRQ